MEKNQIFTAKIDNLGMNGEGVARVNNEVVFVPFCLEEEVVEGVVINNKSKFAIGKAIKINNENKNRVIPKCEYFAKCGGCNLQHMCYEKQLNFKTKLVKDTLLKVGGIETQINQCIASKNEYEYRNKASFPIMEVNGETKIGMFRVGSHNLVEIKRCELQKEKINLLLKITNEWIQKFNIKGYNELTKKGVLKHIVARELDNQILITLVATYYQIPNLNEYVNLLKEHFTEFGLNINLNQLHNNVILGKDFKHIEGIKQLSVNENDTQYQISSASFYQVNNYIKDKIYQNVVENVEKDSIVVDAYSGAGLLSSFISRKAKMVYGIEIVKQATENANELTKQNGIKNLININGDCAEELPKIIEKINSEVTVVLDPPRKGCDKKVIDSILQNKVNKIIYVSCSPISLAKDLKQLTENGKYIIKFVQPYDMFPQTANVETLVILERNNI